MGVHPLRQRAVEARKGGRHLVRLGVPQPLVGTSSPTPRSLQFNGVASISLMVASLRPRQLPNIGVDDPSSRAFRAGFSSQPDPRRPKMTTETIPTSTLPGVFDAGLPSLDYLQVQDPEDAHRAIAAAHRAGAEAQGITAGPLWQRTPV